MTNDNPKLLLTCPPMLAMKDIFVEELQDRGFEVCCPDVTQTLTEMQLKEMVPSYDGWIVGDDPATRAIIEKGVEGRLRAVIKWGAGVDNIDQGACRDSGVYFSNTPGMFDNEVADVALGYVIGLARQTFYIDREVRSEGWPKPRGVSLKDRVAGIVGLGGIGMELQKRLEACGLVTIGYDPGKTQGDAATGKLAEWPDCVEQCDVLIFTCALNENNRHMLDDQVLDKCADGVQIINVARGALINEDSLVTALGSGKVGSVALDVFETEPLPRASKLRGYSQCVFGSHNASNTEQSVVRASRKSIDLVTSALAPQ